MAHRRILVPLVEVPDWKGPTRVTLVDLMDMDGRIVPPGKWVVQLPDGRRGTHAYWVLTPEQMAQRIQAQEAYRQQCLLEPEPPQHPLLRLWIRLQKALL